MAKCDSIVNGGIYTGWRFFRRDDFAGMCLTTESPVRLPNRHSAMLRFSELARLITCFAIC